MPWGKDCTMPPLFSASNRFFMDFGIPPPSDIPNSDFTLDEFDPLAPQMEEWTPLKLTEHQPPAAPPPVAPQQTSNAVLLEQLQIMQQGVHTLTDKLCQLTVQVNTIRDQQTAGTPAQPPVSTQLPQYITQPQSQTQVVTRPIFTMASTAPLSSVSVSQPQPTTSISPTIQHALQLPVNPAHGLGYPPPVVTMASTVQPPVYQAARPPSSQPHAAPLIPPADTAAMLNLPTLQPTHSVTPHVQPPTTDVVMGDAVIPAAVITDALQGAFVDLSKFLIIPNPASEHETVTVRNGKLSFSSKMSGTPISTYEVWLSAWANYEEVLIHNLPHDMDIYRRCNEYRRFIHECQKKYKWPAVYNYDTKFRRHLAKGRSLAFDGMDMKSYALALDPSQLRDDLPRCRRCNAIDHLVKECPFPASAQVETTKTKKADEICFNFNAGRCHNTSCHRRHICRHCQGSSPAITCGCQAKH